MKGLMLHCGAEQITRNELANVLPINGAMGARHNPVPYIDFVERSIYELEKVGFKIKSEGYGVTKQGARMFGLLELESPYSDYAPMYGFRGSYDQTLPRQGVFGSTVFVCDNLMLNGAIEFKTKQTTNINERLPALIHDSIVKLPEMMENQHKQFQAYKEIEINPRHGDAAIIELVRRKVLTPSQVGRTIAEWDTPKHEEHAQYGNSLWRLMNAVTEAIKPANEDNAAVLGNMARTGGLTKFLDEIVKVKTAA